MLNTTYAKHQHFAKHKHLAKHKNAGERVTEGVREMIRASYTPSRVLQYGRCPPNL